MNAPRSHATRAVYAEDPTAALSGLRRRGLLPEDEELGWTPYAWLIFLVSFFIEPAFRIHHGTLSITYAALTLLAIVAFLTSYFAGFWVRGRALVLVIGLQTLLAVAFTTSNLGAAVFFIYAASFAARLERPSRATLGILLIAGVGATTAWLATFPLWAWINAAGFPLLIGFVTLHQERVRRGNARLRIAHERIEELAAIAERERIARDMHDVLGHTLSLIVLKSELASKLASRDPERAASEIRDVETVARKALAEVREAIRGYRATLAGELEQSRTILRAADVRADIQIDPIPFGRDIEEALALALREAITNIVRHARANTCSVRLRASKAGATLVVEDDGRTDAAHAPEGHGLRGMRERVEALGGTVRHRPPHRRPPRTGTAPLHSHPHPHRSRNVSRSRSRSRPWGPTGGALHLHPHLLRGHTRSTTLSL